jgi:hypothetical protein
MSRHHLLFYMLATMLGDDMIVVEVVHNSGPWVPRYVTTGCDADFVTGLATVTPATTKKVVRMELKETMLVI